MTAKKEQKTAQVTGEPENQKLYTHEQHGNVGLPKFDKSKLMGRVSTQQRDKLHVPEEIKKLADSEGLSLRWVNMDENGRFEGMEENAGYAPVTQNGSNVTIPAGAGMRAALMATSQEVASIHRKARKDAIIDPTNPRAVLRGPDGESVSAAVPEGTYIPEEQKQGQETAVRQTSGSAALI